MMFLITDNISCIIEYLPSAKNYAENLLGLVVLILSNNLMK